VKDIITIFLGQLNKNLDWPLILSIDDKIKFFKLSRRCFTMYCRTSIWNKAELLERCQ